MPITEMMVNSLITSHNDGATVGAGTPLVIGVGGQFYDINAVPGVPGHAEWMGRWQRLT